MKISVTDPEEQAPSEEQIAVDVKDGVSSDELLGREVFEWKASDGSRWCTFGRPQGIITPIVTRLLGRDAENSTLEMQLRALMAIRTWNDTAVPSIRTIDHWRAAEQRFESDENYLDYFGTWMTKMNPIVAALVKEAEKEGMKRAEVERVIANAQKEQTKKSPRRGRSAS